MLFRMRSLGQAIMEHKEIQVKKWAYLNAQREMEAEIKLSQARGLNASQNRRISGRSVELMVLHSPRKSLRCWPLHLRCWTHILWEKASLFLNHRLCSSPRRLIQSKRTALQKNCSWDGCGEVISLASKGFSLVMKTHRTLPRWLNTYLSHDEYMQIFIASQSC